MAISSLNVPNSGIVFFHESLNIIQTSSMSFEPSLTLIQILFWHWSLAGCQGCTKYIFILISEVWNPPSHIYITEFVVEETQCLYDSHSQIVFSSALLLCL